MESTKTDLPANAIIVDLRIQSDEVRGKKLMNKLRMFVSDEEWDVFIEYMTSEISYRLVTDKSSPVLGAMQDALVRIKEMVSDDFSELDDLIDAQDEVIRAQNAEIADLKGEISTLSSKNKTLSSSLTRIRKLLKADDVKEALGFCDKLQKQSVAGEIGKTAVLLADSIKNSLITIKGV